MLIRQPLIDRSGQHPPNFMTEVLDLGKSRLLGWTIASKATGCHRSNAFVKLLSGLGRQLDPGLSVLAHASFLPKCANFARQWTKDNAPGQNQESEFRSC
jgi:hypothetical protein